MSVPIDSEPKFSRSQTVEQLKDLVKKLVADETFDSKWRTLMGDYEKWEASPLWQGTSRVNVRLEFLRGLCSSFPERKLNTEPAVIELLLAGSGLRDVGDTFKGREPNGKAATLAVIRREVTDRFGILYTLETQDGSRFTQEFFD
jgi:hypothetical protein